MSEDNTTVSVSGMEGIRTRVRIACVVTYSIITVMGILGNGLVIYVTGFKMKRTVNSVWFLNLALADFLFTAFLIFSTITLQNEYKWMFGNFMCKLNTLVNAINMFASIFFLTAISLDRCLSTWVVVWAHNKRTVCKAKIISAVIWVVATACSAPYAAIREVQDGRCTYNDYSHIWNLGIFRFIVGFAIPFFIIFFCYVAIGVRAERLHGIRRWKSRRTIFVVILAFFVCWLPFHVVELIGLLEQKPNYSISYIAGPVTLSLAFLNSCLNPILYVFMCDDFQKKLQKSICFVLESALAEDQLSFMSSRSFSSHLSRISRKSGSVAPVEIEDTPTAKDFHEVFSTVDS